MHGLHSDGNGSYNSQIAEKGDAVDIHISGLNNRDLLISEETAAQQSPQAHN